MKTLTQKEKLLFLQLAAQIQSPAIFKQKLDLEPGEVQAFKNEFGIESPREAELLFKKLSSQIQPEVSTVDLKAIRAKEAAANKRLEESLNKPMAPFIEPDISEIKHHEAAAQQKLSQSVDQLETPSIPWKLELVGNKFQQNSKITDFHKDIVNYGMSFCKKKYGATAQQIRYEAKALGLSIQWDLIPR